MNAQRAGLAATLAVIAASIVSIVVGVSQARTHPTRHQVKSPAALSPCHHHAQPANGHPGRRCPAT